MTASYRQTDSGLRSCPDPSLFLYDVAHGVWNGGHNVIMRSLALGEPLLGCAHMIVRLLTSCVRLMERT